jgi:hypothetical protein
MMHGHMNLKKCACLYLMIEPSYFSYLITYTYSMITVQNEWHICIYPGCTPCYGCVLCTIFLSFLLLTDTHEVSKNKLTACLTGNCIVGLQIVSLYSCEWVRLKIDVCQNNGKL